MSVADVLHEIAKFCIVNKIAVKDKRFLSSLIGTAFAAQLFEHICSSLSMSKEGMMNYYLDDS